MSRTESSYDMAFPSHIKLRNKEGEEPFRQTVSYGLSKREYFAGLAMQGLLATMADDVLVCGEQPTPKTIVKLIGTRSVKYADALLAELEKQ